MNCQLKKTFVHCLRTFPAYIIILAVTLLSLPDNSHALPFINEIHYDNDGSDINEGVEIAGEAGLDLMGWQLFFYNGNDGEIYKTHNLSGIISDQQNGFGTVSFSIDNIQNGGFDGIALTYISSNVIQFLSYEGVLTAQGGAASGIESTDIIVSESNSSTPASYSLQLTGSGNSYSDFTWNAPSENTFGFINNGQSFTQNNTPNSAIPTPEPTTLLLFLSGLPFLLTRSKDKRL